MRARTLPAGVSQLLRAACSIAALGVCAVVPAAAIGPAAATASVPRTLANTSLYEDLPDAPDANLSVDPAPATAKLPGPGFAAFDLVGEVTVSPVSDSTANRKLTKQELDAGCQSGALRGKQCKLDWLPMLWEAFEATTVENTGNIALDSDTRNALTTHPFFASWFKCVHQYRYRQWSDDTTFIVHDIGHPMQGAAVYSIFDQNDPKSRGLLFINNGNYWRAQLKGMAFVTLYEIQWKIGPASEASIGNSGYNTYYTPRVIGRSTNETGFQDFVITPVYGLGWHIMEDMVDRFVMPHIWKRTHNKWILTALLPLTPTRAAANWLRYKPAYYRDYPLTPLR